jgi:hypothetical protein
MYRDEEYDLRVLERGLGMRTSEIIHQLSLMGYRISEPTLSRLRTGANVNIDVAGIPFLAVRSLFPTLSGVAIAAQTAVWVIRWADLNKLTGDELVGVLNEVEEQIKRAQNQYDQLKDALDEDTVADRTLDRASIAEAKGQLAASHGQHLAALTFFLEAFDIALPAARARGKQLGVVVCLGRNLAAALNEAYDCDEGDKRPVGKAPVGEDWHLWKVVQHYKSQAPSMFRLLKEGADRIGDDRLAANHADGFALAGEYRYAAAMLQVGLAHTRKKTRLEAWQPLGRDKPVINEEYMTEAVAYYERMEQAKEQDAKKRVAKFVITAIVGFAAMAALAVVTLAQADARPGRITMIDIGGAGPP